MKDNLENKVPDMKGCTRPRDEKGPSSLGLKEDGGVTASLLQSEGPLPLKRAAPPPPWSSG